MSKNLFVSLAFALVLALGLVLQSGCGKSVASGAKETPQSSTGGCCPFHAPAKVEKAAGCAEAGTCPKIVTCVCAISDCECCDACKNGGECKCEDCKCPACSVKAATCKCEDCACCDACKNGGECKCEDCKCCEACPK